MQSCPAFIGGEWREISGVDRTPIYNPSRGEVIAEVPACTKEHVDLAVDAAAAASPAWRDTPPVERARLFFRYRQLVEENFDRICQSVSREHGKTLAEARGSAYRGIENIEYACAIPSLLMGDTLENIARGVDCETLLQPLGVCVGITPFNFPAMIPLWMYPLALACGNTFVLKPSEKVPLTAINIARLLERAGVPHGAFNLMHGGREFVTALITHPKVRAISFVGSTPVARHIFETGTRHGKRVQANGGAKNYVLIMPDADLENSTRGVIEGAFGCAGERCMASSTALLVSGAGKAVLPSLRQAATSLKVGPTDRDPQPDVGPLITREHRNRVAELIETGVNEGAKIVADGRAIKVDLAPNGFYLAPTILDEVQSGMTVAREEIFGPVLNVMQIDDLDAAIETVNRSAYGNGASIFTRSGKAAREFKHRVKAGMVGINIGVPASMAWFPFAGWSDSFFGELHMQGKEGVQFFTEQKVITSRWFGEEEGSIWSNR